MRYSFILGILFLGCFGSAPSAHAATLSASPSTGVYSTGSTFTVRVIVNSAGKPINAADGTLSFNPSELSVVSASRGGSIFNLWVTEPTVSGGSITFSGGIPSGYTGGAGNVMTVTFRAKGSGPARVSFSGGSVLANDGRGTNVLTSMDGGNYTIQAATPTPAPEQVIVEYVAPANTPGAPSVTSSTHPDQKKWYAVKEAVLNWDVPSGVTAVRTALDTHSTAVPTKVYDTPMKTLKLADVPEGVSYFHIQFKNKDGWGKVTHFRLAIDNQKPSAFTITLPEGADLSAPVQTLELHAVDATSPVLKFKIQIDTLSPYEFIATTSQAKLTLPSLSPGVHNVTIEAFDAAQNSLTSNFLPGINFSF